MYVPKTKKNIHGCTEGCARKSHRNINPILMNIKFERSCFHYIESTILNGSTSHHQIAHSLYLPLSQKEDEHSRHGLPRRGLRKVFCFLTLDYVRSHEIKFVHRRSVFKLQLSLYLMRGFLPHFSCFFLCEP